MATLLLLLLGLLSITLMISLSLYLMGEKVTWRYFLLLILLEFVFNFLSNRFSWPLLIFWGEDIYYLILSFLVSYNTGKSLPLKLFNGLLPSILNNLSLRLLTFFFFPFFHISIADYQSSPFIRISSYIISLTISLLFAKLFKGSFTNLQKLKANASLIHIIIVSNGFMLSYTLFLQTLMYLEDTTHSSTLELRKFALVISLILFFIMIIFLDRGIREMIQGQLDFQKNLQLENLNTYNKRIEGLYNSVRGFRHDYSNLMITLRLGIEQNDMTIVKEVYDSVLKDSEKRLNTNHFDLAKLVNIEDNTLKSLLSAKVLEANDKEIDTHLNIPEPIHLEGMEILDFIIVTSIFLDNAIENTLESKSPQLSLTFFKDKETLILIVSNQTKEKEIETSQLFDIGVSSKGRKRGIGLANVTEILNHYKNSQLITHSQDYIFTQELIITR